MNLKITKDRKVANSVMPSGKQARIANAFSLPAGHNYSCPGATEYCEAICYAGKLEKIFKGFRDNVIHNWDILKDMSGPDMEIALRSAIGEFVKECDKWNAPKHFRIHADGDFFNADYTMAWIRVMHLYPNVQFWVYTRVANSAVMIHKAMLDNCSLYFSADPVNVNIAVMLNRLYGINVAMVANTFDEGKALIPDIKATRCPENNKSIPLISSKGSACEVCGLCIFGRKSVLFSKTKR
jgi:Gene product 88